MLKAFQIFIIFFLGFFHTFAIDIKMSDSIAPFFDEQEKIKHYSNIPFEQIDLYEREKFIDEKQMQKSLERFKFYAKKLKENGYNSISLDDLNHLILFEKSNIYPKKSSIYKRNTAYRNYYKKIINIAIDNDLEVYINTDLQFYTDLLEEKIGKIDIKNKKLKEVNKEAFSEIFLHFPEISGIILRVGEGGSSYNAGNYKSKVIYKTPNDVNNFLKYILPTFEENDKKLIFRTWTIGIGEIGNLMYDTETYDKAFGGIKSANLIISIKHTSGDYFWFEDLNPTIGHGSLSQIVEIQVRREYEGGGDFPNYIGEYYKHIFQEIKKKRNVVGVYNWNQTGGWGWGKNIIFNFGFNFWNEINFYAVGNIFKNGEPNLKKILLEKYDFTEIEREILYDILKQSREIVKKGWYINDFRKQNLKIGKVKVPPLLWIWWDKTTSSPVILSLIYNSLEDTSQTLEESSFLLGVQKAELETWKKNMQKNNINKEILISLENRYKIFEINHIFKKSFFKYFETGEKKYFEEIQEKIDSYNDFKRDKVNINFDFSEIENFYKQKDFSIFYLFLNILSFFIYFVFFINYPKIREVYRKNFKTKVGVLGFLVFNISLLLFSPFLFLSKYNFYWFLVYINIFLTIFISFYFVFISKILSYLYKEKVILERSLGKIIYFLAPIIFILEFIIVLSYFFGEQFFWKVLTLGFFSSFYKYFLTFIFFMYVLIFVYYGFKLSNIHKFLNKKKHINKIYILIFSFLILFLIFIFSLDYTKIIFENILEKILPSYFFSAGSDVGEFF